MVCIFGSMEWVRIIKAHHDYCRFDDSRIELLLFMVGCKGICE